MSMHAPSRRSRTLSNDRLSGEGARIFAVSLGLPRTKHNRVSARTFPDSHYRRALKGRALRGDYA